MSAQRRPSYWALRLERWGAWRVGAGGIKSSSWAQMRGGGDLSNWATGEDAVPRLYLEERETHDLIAHLARHAETADLARFALAAYPHTAALARKLGVAPSSLAERHKRLHRTLARMLDQRKRGEPIDPARRPARGKRISVRLERTRVAAVHLDA